jgi:hypothetical protein
MMKVMIENHQNFCFLTETRSNKPEMVQTGIVMCKELRIRNKGTTVLLAMNPDSFGWRLTSRSSCHESAIPVSKNMPRMQKPTIIILL